LQVFGEYQVARLRSNAPVAAPSKLELLTPRELETLVWLAKGVSNKHIARGMGVAESTIKVHVQNILRKLELSSRVQARCMRWNTICISNTQFWR
jgi:two-component system, NarL family, nitrate/nitrite response regulator NarL